MQSTIVTRSGWDRIRYTSLFEAILHDAMGAALAMLSEQSMLETGALAIILSVIAMIVSVVFNEVYDRVDARYGRVPTERSFMGRALHAVAFESILVIVSMPFIMWWMASRRRTSPPNRIAARESRFDAFSIGALWINARHVPFGVETVRAATPS